MVDQSTERPIIFSAPMVRALLDGTKTQTRRIVKPQPPDEARSAGVITSSTRVGAEGEWWWLDSPDLMEAGVVGDEFRCPYGQPGDRLWVRETFAHWNARELFGAGTMPTTAFRAGRPVLRPPPGEPTPFDQWTREWSDDTKPKDMKWTPSIHMPRWASRITLEITDVRVERLQEISGADALSEGVQPRLAARMEFASLWRAINGPDAWSADPWVWVLTFRRLEATSA